MKKLFLLFFATIGLFSCSTEEDDIIDNQPQQYQYNITISGNLVYGNDGLGNYVEVPLVVTANPDPTNVAIKLLQSSNDIGGGFNPLTGGNGVYTQPDNRFYLDPAIAQNGVVTVEVYAIEPGTDGFRSKNVSANFTLQWPDDTDPNDPDPDTALVRFTSIERIEVPAGDPYYRLGYSDCSNTDGFVTIELWKGGVYQNITMDRALIQNSGFIETDPFNNLIVDSDYQLRIINTSGQVPVFKFLDINDNEMNSHIFNFTAVANAPVVSVSSLVTDNITATSFNADLQYSIDTTNPQTLSVKLFESTDLNNPISGQEQSQQTTGSGTEIFNTMFNGLNTNTEYTFRYYLNDVQFFESIETTADNGSYRTEIENLSADVNNVIGIFEYDNTTGADILATLEFSGVAVDGSPLVLSESVTFINGNTNTDITVMKTGFKQNSVITVNIIVNGQVEETATISTNGITATSYALNPGSILTPNNTTGILGATIAMTTDGAAETSIFNLSLVSTAGLNPNNYIDSARIGNGQNISLNWVETSTGSGIWEASIIQTESIIATGINSYEIYFRTENYSTVDPSGIDSFVLSTTIVDDNNVILGQGSAGVTIQCSN